MGVRLADPHQLQAKPEADELGFGRFFTDHMLKIFHHKNLGGWQKPQITPLENLVLHPAAKVLHYAVEVRWLFGDNRSFDNTKDTRGKNASCR